MCGCSRCVYTRDEDAARIQARAVVAGRPAMMGPAKIVYTPNANNMADLINRPHHYIAENGMECIDVIEAFGLGFRLGNVLKYLLRAEKKGGVESLKKARWYLDREITKREGVTNDKR